MKKVFALAIVGAFAVALVACGGKKAEDAAKAVEDSIRKADSIAAAAAAADTLTVDSLSNQ